MRSCRAALLVAFLGGCVGSIDGIGPAGPVGPGSPGTRGPGAGPPVNGVMPGQPGQPGQPGGSTLPPGMTTPSSNGLPAVAGPGRLRRLTRTQFESSLRDLLGGDVPIGEVERDTERDGFAAVGASYAALSQRTIEQYDATIGKALAPVFGDPARWRPLAGCTPSGPTDRACLSRFVTGFGRRAWRRPLTAAEVERYTTLAVDAGRALGDVAKGLEQVASALLLTPNFLYRVELGAPDPARPGRYRYSGWEMASRLSYLLWDTTPDDALLAAAESGALDRPEGIRSETQRLLGSPRARAGLAAFATQLMGLHELENTPKDDARYTPGLRAAMHGEVQRLFERLVEPGRSVLDLFDSTQTFANAELARLYGAAGPAGAALEAVELPAGGPRAGLLGTAAFLSLHSEQDGTSPTARGVFVREKLMCQVVVEPPDDVDTTLPNPPPGVVWTRRERLEQHRKLPACAACHAFFDPIGYAFERFDWVGGLRDRDNGKPIDTSGEIDGLAFADARGLAAHLRNLPAVQQCLMENLFRVAFGHAPTDADRPIVTGYLDAFAGVKHAWPALLAELAVSEGFRSVTQAP
jgi:hypothetical protein